MDEDGVSKRGRGRGRGTRARGRGRGRGRGKGKKTAVVVASDEEASLDPSFDGSSCIVIEDGDVSVGNITNVLIETGEDAFMSEIPKDNELVESSMSMTNIGDVHIADTSNIVNTQLEPAVPNVAHHTTNVPQTIDMEADISQLEAPTFTTICRGPPEPMLRLKWNHKVNLIGEKVLNPMIHICDQCDKPILHYGRMIPCKHVFCLKCARTEPVKICPRCSDKVVRVEQSGLGTVFMCTHSGSRYGNTGCRRTYLSQRDLQAHINHRHVTQPPPPLPTATMPSSADIKMDSSLQRKLSESSVAVQPIQAPSALLTQRVSIRSSSSIGTIAPPGSSTLQSTSTHSSLTQANLARINNANAQDCHQGKVALHQSLKKTPLSQSHHQPSESVADASYYSSVLNSFGSSGVSTSTGGNAPYESSTGNNTNQAGGQSSWQQQQYYR